MKYMLLFFADEDAWMEISEEARAAAIERIGAWYGQHAQAGRIIEGRRLRGKGTATTVRLGPAGRSEEPTIVDGPFIEAKEAIGSYAIVSVADLDEAMSLAKSWPGGGVIEIRPVVEE
ncbi:MAG TPA: YciI family protein [Ktedonobacterales bacterium]|jgi:hypothetical protein|nr:YciI family protein [Ktedonobacterales bacterium]